MSTKRAVEAFALDVAAVMVFVLIGRRSHDESGDAVAGAAAVAAPFLLALGCGWLVGRVWRQPTHLAPGLIVWGTTVVLGLALRNLVFDRGTAAPFVIVASITLAVLLLGWRAVWNAVSSRRSRA